MTAAIFPAYSLARLVVSRPYAIFAAVGAGCGPGSLLLAVPRRRAARVSRRDARVPADRARRSETNAVVDRLWHLPPASRFHVRTQLAILFPVLALVLLARIWRWSGSGVGARRGRRGTGSGSRCSLSGSPSSSRAAIGRRSFTWYLATGFLKERMLEYGLWAARRTRDRSGHRSVDRCPRGTGAPAWRTARRAADDVRHAGARSFGVFGLYTAIKAAYLSRTSRSSWPSGT